MPVETELKFKVDTHEAVRARLLALGARPLGAVVETNHILDDPSRRMLAGGRGLRVRECLHLEDQRTTATLTYKGPRQSQIPKRREEIEVGVEAAALACELLTALGFRQHMLFQKRRESWGLDDCRIELDELPRLGRFVEIEGPTPERIERARERLAITSPPMTETYIALLVGDGRRRGLDSTRVTFS